MRKASHKVRGGFAALFKWINRDPKKEAAAGENQYTYTLTNPVRWSDPSGLDVIWGQYKDPNDGGLHGIVIITSPGGDTVIARQAFVYNGDPSYQGIFYPAVGTPGSGKYMNPDWWRPQDITYLRRLVTDEEENRIALDFIREHAGRTDEAYIPNLPPYNKNGFRDCNKYAEFAWSALSKAIEEHRHERLKSLLDYVGIK